MAERIELTQGLTASTESHSALKAAQANLSQVLEEYPLWKNTDSPSFAMWSSFYSAQITRHGQDSVLNLLPDMQRVITEPIRILVVKHQIAKVEDLRSLPEEKIEELKGIGQKYANLVSAMRQVAIAAK